MGGREGTVPGRQPRTVTLRLDKSGSRRKRHRCAQRCANPQLSAGPVSEAGPGKAPLLSEPAPLPAAPGVPCSWARSHDHLLPAGMGHTAGTVQASCPLPSRGGQSHPPAKAAEATQRSWPRPRTHRTGFEGAFAGSEPSSVPGSPCYGCPRPPHRGRMACPHCEPASTRPREKASPHGAPDERG